MPSKEERAKAQAEADAAAKKYPRKFKTTRINTNDVTDIIGTKQPVREPSRSAITEASRPSTDKWLEDYPRKHFRSSTAQAQADAEAKKKARRLKTAHMNKKDVKYAMDMQELRREPSSAAVAVAKNRHDIDVPISKASSSTRRTESRKKKEKKANARPDFSTTSPANADADAEAKKKARRLKTAHMNKKDVKYAMDMQELRREPSSAAVAVAKNRHDIDVPISKASSSTRRTESRKKKEKKANARPDFSTTSPANANADADAEAKKKARRLKTAHINKKDVADAMDTQELRREPSSAAVAVAKNRHDIDVPISKASSSTRRTESRKKKEKKANARPDFCPYDPERSLSNHSRTGNLQPVPGTFSVCRFDSAGNFDSMHSIDSDNQASLGDLSKLVPSENKPATSEERLIEAFIVEEPEYIPQVMAVSLEEVQRRKRLIYFGLGAMVLVNLCFVVIIQPNSNADLNIPSFEENAAIIDANFQFIPGTQNTISGYDNELGSDPICWEGRSQDNPFEDEVLPSPTFINDPLVDEFFLGGALNIQVSCPIGTYIEGFVPEEFGEAPRFSNGIRPLTGRNYTYTLNGTIDFYGLNGSTVVSDQGPRLAFELVLCELGTIGFCTPHVHEQTDARLATLNRTQVAPPGTRHGGSHVHSGYTILEVPANATKIPFEVGINIVVKDPGEFFAIGAVKFYTADSQDQAPQFRYDVANALNNRILFYQNPPEVLKVDASVKAVTGVWIGLSSLAILFFLIQSLKFRLNQVMLESQGSSLIAFIFAALFATSLSFLFIPKSDFYCKISMPLVVSSLQIVYAVLIARIWRIHKTSCLALVDRTKSMVVDYMSFVDCFAGWKNQRCQSNSDTTFVKEGVTSAHLARVVTFITMPQILLQILSLTVQPQKVYLDLNYDESIGRTECTATDSSGNALSYWKSIQTYGTLFLVFTSILALILSNLGRDLTSLFNEAKNLKDALLTSNILMLFFLGMILVLDEETALSPNIEYIIRIAMVVSTMTNLVIRTMLPKFRMIWRGDTIILPSNNWRDAANGGVLNLTGTSRMNSTPGDKGASDGSMNENNIPDNNQDTETRNNEDSIRSRTAHQSASSPPIVIRDEEAPPTNLLVRLKENEHLFREINSLTMSGQPVPHALWEKARFANLSLGEVFQKRVQFDWATENEEHS